MDNAVEASAEQGGEIVVSLATTKEGCPQIKIADGGKGIPTPVLEQLKKGKILSFGKKGGHGIGLAHARKVIGEAGGRLDMESREKRGTIVTINLPKTAPPDWFAREICLDKAIPLVVLDDDPGIHALWRERLKGRGLQTFFCTSTKEAQTLTARKGRFQFLCDFDLGEEKKDGLGFMEEFKLAKERILITSFFEDPKIQERCRQSGIKIVPKGMLGKVPLRFTPPKARNYDMVFLENEKILRRGWETGGGKAGEFPCCPRIPLKSSKIL